MTREHLPPGFESQAQWGCLVPVFQALLLLLLILGSSFAWVGR